MMFRWWMSSPRSSKASRMCQYACFPAPKTTTSCTFARFLKSIVLASAVRKAVISSALIRARGEPDLSKRVRLPFGVVLGALEVDGVAEAVVAEEVLDLVECSERERLEMEELRDWVEGVLFWLAVRSVTILTPMPSLEEAGMSNVVWPSLRFSDVRSGWYDEQQPLCSSSVAVE